MVLLEKSVDPRVKRTRKLLQQAFMELMAEKDMASISIGEITDRATVNRATFYAHFPDKYALLDSIIREMFQQALIRHLPPAPAWNMQSLRALVRAAFGFMDEFHANCKPSDRQFDPRVEQAVQQELAEVLLAWLKQARVAGKRPGIRLELVASVVSWAIFGPAVQWGRKERTPSADEMADQTLLVITEGLAHLAPDFLPG
ncbi:MAG TPA: TetR/AcrR family transcriptional regulator [Ktedonobacteraceae bacterium]|jgi:AcrR family transcriptional regulator|nr:TetR/AcrR family transcriptional regulator [Ktedonobacteraceae bacterium]